MTTENLITVLDLARLELETAYKRLGYSNSNILTSINESIVHLQCEALSQAAVSGTFCECISRIGVSGPEHGPWICRSCQKEVAK